MALTYHFADANQILFHGKPSPRHRLSGSASHADSAEQARIAAVVKKS
jgi:hypothetical protein